MSQLVKVKNPDPFTLPVLPLRDLVLFPGIAIPIAVGRLMTLRSIEAAHKTEQHLVLAVTQREDVDEVTPEGLYTLGTIARIQQIHRTLGGVQILLHGESRGMAVRYRQAGQGYLEAVVREIDIMPPVQPEDAAFLALYREARERAGELGQRIGHSSELINQVLAGAEDPDALADLVAGYIDIPTAERQSLLEILPVEERLRRVLIHVQRQINVMEAQEDIHSKVQEELGDRQREIYLREQLKAIRTELGDTDDAEDLEELREKLAALELPEDSRKEVDRELRRLSRIGREAMEAQVIRTFLETVSELPWSERSEEQLDLLRAEEILDEDHYGLEDVKDRVLEFLAVRQLHLEAAREAAAAAGEDSAAEDATAGTATQEAIETGEASSGTAGDEAVIEASDAATGKPDPTAPARNDESDETAKAPILLFAGPPGVGKTSLAKSIARAMGRNYVRVSLGGARDEADIRGHRRTYVGAMPGRILQGMKQAGTRNPVFLLDEVDKLGVSFQGDPASALLEVLDPAQNDSFTDHYLGIPFDLSEVLFICTANFLQNIPGPLLDRLELVEFSGYTEGEKLAIARQYLIPRQLRRNGLNAEQLRLGDDAVARLISEFTREAGVRQLEREIGRLGRKVARRIAVRDVESMEIGSAEVRDLLGRPKVHPEKMAVNDQVGVATGMYYTPTGGDIMFVEARKMPGKGELTLTGQLGDVMKESARAAWSYARSNAADVHLTDEEFRRDIHIHVPAGAIPKDGPSAGITMATALISTLAGRPVRHDLAMTGELTLSGRVLPIGGVKEKILGAVRAGIRSFVLPRDNEADLEDLPDEVRVQIDVKLVGELGEVLACALRGVAFEGGRLIFGAPRAEEIEVVSA